MTASIRLGRIAGIPIGASWSVVLIGLLIAWSLAGTILPSQVPGLVPAAYWLAGVGGAGLFLASLLAHELGHALVARRAGLRVRGITLWLLGGVALLEDEPANPRDELRVAAVGPAVSLLVAAGAALAAVALGLAGGPALAVAVAGWLAVGNAVLAVFNLLPAAPLDGGRVLRGLLWRRHGDRLRAAVSATRAGQLVGAGLIVYGLLGAFTGWGIGTLWTALVGWFLTTAARQERDHAVARSRLGGLRAADLPGPLITAPAYLTVDAVLRTYVEPWRPAALALQTFDGRPAGVVTAATLRAVPAARRHLLRAGDLATPPAAVPVVGPETPAADLAARLDATNPVAAVVADGRLLGLVTWPEVQRATIPATGKSSAAA